jgi:hypothetical protein
LSSYVWLYFFFIILDKTHKQQSSYQQVPVAHWLGVGSHAQVIGSILDASAIYIPSSLQCLLPCIARISCNNTLAFQRQQKSIAGNWEHAMPKYPEY